VIADLSAFFAAHPVAHPNPPDFEPDGTLFSMVAVHDKLYAIEPNQGRLLEINPENGKVRQLVDFSASEGHIVPTAMVFDGVFRVGNLNTFPIMPGSAKILDVTKRGRITDELPGYTAITGLALDSGDNLFVLELSTAPGGPMPGAGKLILSRDDRIKEILTGLNFPAGNMAFGPDGALYLSNFSSTPDSGRRTDRTRRGRLAGRRGRRYQLNSSPNQMCEAAVRPRVLSQPITVNQDRGPLRRFSSTICRARPAPRTG
jgi:hypothetical protein